MQPYPKRVDAPYTSQLESPRKGARNDWGSLGPWFDMMNHSATNYNVGYQFKPDYGLEITALRDINPEEELLITYGNNSDDDMFMFYGLVEAFLASLEPSAVP